MSPFGHFFYKRSGSKRNSFFSYRLIRFEPTMLQQQLSTYTPHLLLIKLTVHTKQHTTMVDRLSLANLSIQNMTHPPAEITQPIKTKKAHLLKLPNLSHSLSLDILPSPTDRWMGFFSIIISYAHFYFYCDQVLLTHAYAASTTAITIGDGGDPGGSTELDDKSGHNCWMTDAEFQVYACLVLGLDPTNDSMGTGGEGHKQCDHSLVNMLLADFTRITNLHPAIHNEIADDQRALARALACCSLLLLGSDAFTPSII
jgi:hypothetical protein